jgi:hypothetical protein
MYTLHPARTSPEAIISPMPLDPPVTTATLPRTENNEEMSPSGEVSPLAVISVLPVIHGFVAGSVGHRS